MKYIREMRAGRPKTYKTGAVVGSYPKPMLYLGFDRGGIDIIPPKAYTPKPGDIPVDCCYEDIAFPKTGTMAAVLKLPTQPVITCFDYTTDMNLDLALDYSPTKSQEAAIKFQNPGTGDYNLLTQYIRSGKPFPWKTVVVDSMTGYGDMMKNHLSSFNPNAMIDARQWAFMVGEQQRKLCLSLTGFPCHVVVIFHTQEPEVNEETKQVSEIPNAYAKSFRDVVSGMFSQYFYACKSGNKPVVKNSDFMFVKGVGARWPAGLPAECAPDFKSIYGKELQ